jgi:hypothetical protein
MASTDCLSDRNNPSAINRWRFPVIGYFKNKNHICTCCTAAGGGAVCEYTHRGLPVHRAGAETNNALLEFIPTEAATAATAAASNSRRKQATAISTWWSD